MNNANHQAITPRRTSELVRAMRATLQPGERLLHFGSVDDAHEWLSVHPAERRAWRRTVRTPHGETFLIIGATAHPSRPQTVRHPQPRTTRPLGVSGRVIFGFFAVPLATALVLLLWQPLWTLLTLAAVTGLAVWSRTSGRGSVIVETFTRVKVKR